jgi:archaemetzincin
VEAPGFTLYLVPVGAEDEEVMDHLERELVTMGARIVRETSIPAPADAYDRRRDQYQARHFLRLLGAYDGDRILGVTDRDLYMKGLRFVFGQAEAPGRTAVISLNRLKWGVDVDGFMERCIKEATHELGHTFGMGHCDDPDCIMHFSVSLADTDVKSRAFCKRCSSEMEDLMATEARARATGTRIRG